MTNADGRAPNLLTREQFIPGKYMIRFETEAYFKDTGVLSFFYPYVEVGKCNLESTEAERWVSWAKLSLHAHQHFSAPACIVPTVGTVALW